MQVESRAADLSKEVQRLQGEVDRLHSELNSERGSRTQQASCVGTLEKQLQDKSSSLVRFYSASAKPLAQKHHVISYDKCHIINVIWDDINSFQNPQQMLQGKVLNPG